MNDAAACLAGGTLIHGNTTCTCVVVCTYIRCRGNGMGFLGRQAASRGAFSRMILSVTPRHESIHRASMRQDRFCAKGEGGGARMTGGKCSPREHLLQLHEV